MIKTKSEYRNALRLAKALIEDINEYEDKHFPIEPPTEEETGETGQKRVVRVRRGRGGNNQV